jgi:hypothetical protein
VFLSDIQKVRSQLLQLTAGDAHQSSVQAYEGGECTQAHNGSYELLAKEIVIKREAI